MMNIHPNFSRRSLLQSASAGFGLLAFRALAASAETSPLAPKVAHFAPRAKRVIFLCMRGGPSHVDTFDHKPRLIADGGRDSSYAGSKWLPPLWDFQQRGQSGLWMSDAFPHLAEHADDLCLLRGMHCDQPSHAQAYLQMHTGSSQFVRPSMGAWALFGLGTENQGLPGYVSINPPTSLGGGQNFGSAFLPASYQGTRFSIQDASQRNRPIDRRRRGEVNEDGLPNLKPSSLTRKEQRLQIELINALNREKLSRDPQVDLVESAIESYELAFRMQETVPGVLDLATESDATKALYGIDDELTRGFGTQCLLARRLAEAGVRFIELGHGSWDHHSNLRDSLGENCAQTDTPIAGLLADLKQRDLLKDTLVIWGGEFGRTPHSPDANGRDHNHKGYTTWMAGGGVKGGFAYGETDEYGREAVDGKVHIHDWHATILHLLGLDHEQLNYRHAGRDMRLTDVHGSVVREIFA